MPVPNTQEIRKPLLEVFKNGVPRNLLIGELLEIMSESLGKNLDEISSDDKNIFKDNIAQAENYLIKKQLLACPVKNTYMIKEKGLEVLAQNPQVIDDDFLVNMSGKKIIQPEEFSNEETGISVQEATPVNEPEIITEPEKNEDFADNEIEEPLISSSTEEEINQNEDLEPQVEVLDEINENFDDINEIEEPLISSSTEEEINQNEDLEPTVEVLDEINENFDDIKETEEPLISSSTEEEINQNEDLEPQVEVLDEINENFDDINETEEPLISSSTEEEINQTEDLEPQVEVLDEINENFDDIKETEEPLISSSTEEEINQTEDLEPTVEVLDEINENFDDINETEEPDSESDENESENESEDYVDELIQSNGVQEILAKYNSNLADEVLEKIASIPEDKFKMLVIDLLSKMGYFAFQNARYTTEASGSELIQGVILDDKAGGNPIYIQAKKSSPEEIIERSDIDDFIEALSDKGGKGVFATMANFSESAEERAKEEKIMLIDGKKLAALMIANNFGVNVEKIFEFKTIDNEDFSTYEA